jgi:hypothetical protein
VPNDGETITNARGNQYQNANYICQIEGYKSRLARVASRRGRVSYGVLARDVGLAARERLQFSMVIFNLGWRISTVTRIPRAGDVLCRRWNCSESESSLKDAIEVTCLYLQGGF